MNYIFMHRCQFDRGNGGDKKSGRGLTGFHWRERLRPLLAPIQTLSPRRKKKGNSVKVSKCYRTDALGWLSPKNNNQTVSNDLQ